MLDIVKEKPNKESPPSISIEDLKTITNQMENCIYKIQNDDKNGTGFICKIPFLNDLKILITNYNLLNEEDLNSNKVIKLKRDNMDEKKITIDNTRIKACINKEITIIEIKPNKDKIFLNTILDLDTEKKDNYTEEQDIYTEPKDNSTEIKENNTEIKDNDTKEKGNSTSSPKLEIKKKSIYIIDKDKLSFSYDIIEYKDNQEINYFCNIKEGSFGSPILSLETFKIFGIYVGNKENINYNIVSMKYLIDELNKVNKIYKNEINLIYIKNTNNDDEENIFGDKFVINHDKEDFDLKINEEESKLVNKWKLKKGENIIKIKIKKKIADFGSMFEGCSSLRNISELEYLDIKNVKFFSKMFSGCSSLSDIKPLEDWDVSSAVNLSDMFSNCESLSDIRPLKKWNVSKVQNFSNMFSQCSSLSDIKPLEDWNVSNAINFSDMFSECTSLKDITPLKNWNVSKANDFSNMFMQCKELKDITSLKNWNVSNVNDFSNMFMQCESLSDIKSLEKWNVLEGTNFSFMFSQCSKLSDIEPLKNWNVSKSEDFSNMFCKCKKLSNIEPLKEWKVSNKAKFNKMFINISSLSDGNKLKQWNLPDNAFKSMFE